MTENWTFSQRLAGGFALVVLLTVAMGILAVASLQTAVDSKDQVIAVNAENLTDGEHLRAAAFRASAAVRAALLTGDKHHLDTFQQAVDELSVANAAIETRSKDDETRALLQGVDRAWLEWRSTAEEIVAERGKADVVVVAAEFEQRLFPKWNELFAAFKRLVDHERQNLDRARQQSTDAARRASNTLLGLVAATVLLAALIALALSRALSRQIGVSVQHVKSSSAELQATATQQATGAKEQAAAMAEIATTISELLATSRQIAESAKQVARIAADTADGARSGDDTVRGAQGALSSIKTQVDVIVAHMLELGKKSQQIGGILEIVAELAEQTNILAINATIEAAGAGDAGRRFAVVGEEIRRLADRVGGSTKEIRGLIDEIRGAVNTTVMATESGSKTVDAGAQRFDDVASSFRRIGKLVDTTTEAAREIELSTKQQASAVEQVNAAISNVAQATREAEAASGQTLQTADELAKLSTALVKLVQTQAAE